jgi:hypothetical protein
LTMRNSSRRFKEAEGSVAVVCDIITSYSASFQGSLDIMTSIWIS